MGKMETLEHADAIERGLMDIGRASKASGVSVKMIRHYEAIGLLPKVARTLANYRVYTPNDVHVLRFVRRARDLGFSMDEIKELLGLWRNKARSSAAVKKIAGKHIDDLKLKIAELQSMVQTLEHLTKHCHGDHRPECPILDDLASANSIVHDGAK
jgi:MerR family copper efflux transcriptional regulator